MKMKITFDKTQVPLKWVIKFMENELITYEIIIIEGMVITIEEKDNIDVEGDADKKYHDVSTFTQALWSCKKFYLCKWNYWKIYIKCWKFVDW